MNSSVAEFAVFVLRSLLNYHMRMMAGSEAVRVESVGEPSSQFQMSEPYEAWAEGLKEAIRCVMLVHAGEVKSFPEWERWVAHRGGMDPSAEV